MGRTKKSAQAKEGLKEKTLTWTWILESNRMYYDRET